MLCPACSIPLPRQSVSCPRCGWAEPLGEIRRVPLSDAHRAKLLVLALVLPVASAGVIAVLVWQLVVGLPENLAIVAALAVLAAGLIVGSAWKGRAFVNDLREGTALMQLLRLERLSKSVGDDEISYVARFAELPERQISYGQFVRLREGDAYWVTYSPHSRVWWDIQPARALDAG